ncbi:DUF6894 family protein [Sphingomonas sp. BK580]|uniref:DUF6894 family protein n=1 Tax=Sphingomonas sp. BK580 TaxID=2586972 RepID=UPI0016172080|nr:hypothetical protein [Sphingomonas sp. BK580]MBB3695615.1 hypothetical protein [Sphingomonas sp. BK580]
MPSFLFHIQNGSERPETEAVELPSVKAAKEEAVTLAGTMLKDIDGAFWEDGVLCIDR